MPCPTPNHDPPLNVVRLGQFEYKATDLAASRPIQVDTPGLQISHEDENAIHLRSMAKRGHHCVPLLQSDAAEVGVLGFEPHDEPDLDAAGAFFGARRLPAECVERASTGRTQSNADPRDVRRDFYVRMGRLPTTDRKCKLYHRVKPLRIDQFEMCITDVHASLAFCSDVGLRVTEQTEDAASGIPGAVWIRRKRGVHDVAFNDAPGPQLHHFAFWVANPPSIIVRLDLMSTTAYVSIFERGPGRRGKSNALLHCLRDPDGHRIEIHCADMRTVDPDLEPISRTMDDPQRQRLSGALAASGPGAQQTIAP